MPRKDRWTTTCSSAMHTGSDAKRSSMTVRFAVRKTSIIMSRMRRSSLLLLGVVASGMIAAAPVAGTDSPRDVVKKTADDVVAVLADKSLSSPDKRSRIETIVYAQVDFDT